MSELERPYSEAAQVWAARLFGWFGLVLFYGISIAKMAVH